VVAAYQQVVDQDLPGPTRALIERQFQQVRDAHAHMSRLKESHDTREAVKVESGGGGS
jgi:hypothetical protein